MPGTVPFLQRSDKEPTHTPTVSTPPTGLPPLQCCYLLSELLAGLTGHFLVSIGVQFRKQDIKWLSESLGELKKPTLKCVSRNHSQNLVRTALPRELREAGTTAVSRATHPVPSTPHTGNRVALHPVSLYTQLQIQFLLL